MAHRAALASFFRIGLVLLVGMAPAGAADDWQGVERIVAIGDVHGDYGQFTTLLREAGLIDEQDDWIGGRTHLVQTGDVPDRGPDSRKAMDLLMKLEKQARKAKGFVHPLVGNHEAMNVYGDLRYVHPGEYEAFLAKDSEKQRERAYELAAEQLVEPQTADEAFRKKWFAEHPLGWVEHRRAFDPASEYGRWIAGNNILIRINRTLFLHGGIGPKFAEMPLRDMNKQAAAEFGDFSTIPAGMLIDSEGPLWYRGLAQNDEATEAAHLERLLAVHDVDRIVIGHTPTEGAVLPRFGGKVMLIDVGLSAAYGGRRACLVLEGDRAFAIHRGKQLEIRASDDGLVDYLEAAAALDPQPSPLQPLLDRLRVAVPVGQ